MGKIAGAKTDPAAAHWRIASLAVFAVALIVTLVTLDDPGLTWDEPFSIIAGQSYASWFGNVPSLPVSQEGIYQYWRVNCEHPPLAKLLMGFAQAILPEVSPILASRFAVAVLFSLLVELVFQVGTSMFGGLAGLLGALSLLCMPRVFGDAHLASLDVAMALTWLLAAVAFAKAVEKDAWPWSVASGICFGLALLTKINGVLLPIVLLGWGVGFHRRRALWPLVTTLGVGAIVFLVGWPWLWHDTAARLGGYLFPKGRVSLPVLYFGLVYKDKAVPWHYPIVMTLVTVPIGILFLSLLGLAKAVRQFLVRPAQALLVVNLAVILGTFMLPWMPRYDGVRLFLAAFPFLALLAGAGGHRCWVWLCEHSAGRPWRPLFALAALFVTQAGAVGLIHPYELSYYNAAVGGLWGADRLGLEVTYWHDVVNRRVFQWLNAQCPPGSRIAFYPVGEFVVGNNPEESDFYEAFYLNQKRGLQAVRFEPGVPHDYVVLNAREAMMRSVPEAKLPGNPEAWRIFKTREPLFAIRKQGVLLCGVYARE